MPSQHSLTEAFEAALWHRKAFPTGFFSAVMCCSAQPRLPSLVSSEQPLRGIPQCQALASQEGNLKNSVWHQMAQWYHPPSARNTKPPRQTLLSPCHYIIFSLCSKGEWAEGNILTCNTQMISQYAFQEGRFFIWRKLLVN